MELSNEEKKILLIAARQSILQELSECDVTKIDYKAYPKLKMALGAFVTLHIKNELRGCIGYIIAKKPLFEIIVEAAKHSAFGDPRFPELSRDELDDVEIVISVLQALASARRSSGRGSGGSLAPTWAPTGPTPGTP